MYACSKFMGHTKSTHKFQINCDHFSIISPSCRFGTFFSLPSLCLCGKHHYSIDWKPLFMSETLGEKKINIFVHLFKSIFKYNNQQQKTTTSPHRHHHSVISFVTKINIYSFCLFLPQFFCVCVCLMFDCCFGKCIQEKKNQIVANHRVNVCVCFWCMGVWTMCSVY